MRGKGMTELLKDTNLSEVLYIQSEDELKDIIHEEVSSGRKIPHAKVAALYIQGYSVGEIGEIMGCHHKTVAEMIKSEEGKAIRNAMTEDVVSSIRLFMSASGIKAVKTLIECMDSTNDRVRLQASTEILDRIGLKSPEKIEILSKGNSLRGMSEDELLGIIKVGMTELTPGRGE